MGAHRSTRRTWLAGAAALIAARGLGGGAAQAAAAAPQDAAVIRFLNSRGQIDLCEIGDALGWLKGAGISLQSVGYSQGGPESLFAMASGSVDIVGAATPAIINAIAAGAKIIAVMANGGIDKTVNAKFFVLADSKIRTAKDLQGKTIAVNTLGAHLDYTVREYFKRHGMSQDAASLITVPGPQLEEVLRHRQADVVAVGSWQTVFAGEIEANGGVRVLFTDDEVLGDIVIGSYAMEKSFLAKHPGAVRNFVSVSAKAADWAAQNPAAARTLAAGILKKRGDNPVLARYWTGLGVRPHNLYTPHDAQFWIDTLVQAGRLKPGQFTPDDIETNRYNDFASPVRN